MRPNFLTALGYIKEGPPVLVDLSFESVLDFPFYAFFVESRYSRRIQHLTPYGDYSGGVYKDSDNYDLLSMSFMDNLSITRSVELMVAQPDPDSRSLSHAVIRLAGFSPEDTRQEWRDDSWFRQTLKGANDWMSTVRGRTNHLSIKDVDSPVIASLEITNFRHSFAYLKWLIGNWSDFKQIGV